MNNPATPIAIGDRIYLASVDSFAMPIEPTLSEATVSAIDGVQVELDNGAAFDATTMQIIEADKGDDGDVWFGTAFRDPGSRAAYVERERLWLALRLFCTKHGFGRSPVPLDALRAVSAALDLEGVNSPVWEPAPEHETATS